MVRHPKTQYTPVMNAGCLSNRPFVTDKGKDKGKQIKTEARHSCDSAPTLLPRERVEVHVWPQWTHDRTHRIHVRVDSLQSLEVADCSYLG